MPLLWGAITDYNTIKQKFTIKTEKLNFKQQKKLKTFWETALKLLLPWCVPVLYMLIILK